MPDDDPPSAREQLGESVLWSFVATLILTASLRLAQAFGVTRMDIPLMLGTVMTPDRDRAKVLGALAHLVNGWVLGGVYALAFHSLRRSSALLGALIGFVHGLFVLIVALPLLPGVHPRMASDFTGPEPTSRLEPPGFMALNYGRRTPVITLAAHMLYGAIIGHFYETHPRPGRGLLGRSPAVSMEDVSALGSRNR
jgi:hypothetical protein